nr:LamG-like jellyroll fold domain-containing protein [Candidatus Njordarchaeum guaymaensis]
MNGARRKATKILVLTIFILVVAHLQVSPVAADYSQCSRAGWKVITGTEEATIPNIDADDGYFYVVRGAQTGTIPRRLAASTSSVNILAGDPWGGNQLSHLYSSDNVYWNMTSESGSGNYYPGSYAPLGQTSWKSGSLANLNSDDGNYMTFESYSAYSQYGLRFDGTYNINAGNKAGLSLSAPKQNFTIELRVKWNAIPPLSAQETLIEKISYPYGYHLWYNVMEYGKVHLMGDLNWDEPVYSEVTYDLTPTVGVWYHLAWVRNDRNMYLYLNGIRNASAPPEDTYPRPTTASFRIGGYSASESSWYVTLDEVAVWNSSKWTGSSFTVPTSPYLGSEPNLCGLWHLDEGDGMVAHDSSPNHYDGTATNTPLWVAGYTFFSNPPCPTQYALQFDDTYRINVGNKAALNLTAPFTIELKVKWNKQLVFPNDKYIIGKFDGPKGYAIWLEPKSDGSVTIHGQINGQDFTPPYMKVSVDYNFRPQTGAWQHLAWVHDGTQMRIYVNGTNRAQVMTSYLPYNGLAPFIIGGSDIFSGQADNVTLDEVAVWSYTKYTANFAPPTEPYAGNEANLRGLWHLDEGSGATVHDTSSYHNDGTATSTAIWAAGYHRAQILDLVFSGASNTYTWQSLTWKTDLSCTLGNANATIQLFNWTSGSYKTSGAGYLNYITSSTPNVDETKIQTISLNPTQFRNPGNSTWKMKITLFRATASLLQLKCDLAEYSSTVPGAEVEFLSLLPDRNIKSGVSALNLTVEVRCNVSAPIQYLYLFDYSQSTYQLKNVSTIGMTDLTIFIDVTSGMADYLSSTGEVKIKLNSTYPGNYYMSVDFVQWGLKYNEPKWEIEYRVDYQATIPKNEITKLQVKLKSGLDRTAEVAYLLMYNYTISSWTPIIEDVNHTSMLTQWYNTTTPSAIQGFIRSDGCLNVTFYSYDTNWTTINVSTDHLAIWVESPTLDSTPPSPISNLVVVSSTENSVALTWTAPGDDLDSGIVAGYEVKYSTSGPVGTSNWDSATTYSVSWTLLPAGSMENLVVLGLSPDTTYWFAVKGYDEVPNRGGISNSPSGKTSDLVAPAVIDDLVAGSPAVDSITLGWTAPGDNGYDGTAIGYTVRYSTSGPITDESWESATSYVQSWAPMAAGGNETHAVYGLNSSTRYWFAIKAYDEAYNYGAISNCVEGTTTSPQQVGGGSLGSLLLVVIPVSLIVVAGVGVVGLKVMGRSRQVGSKSPFRKRSKTLEGVARPKLREYVGESGVVPQPKKRAKFEEESGAEKNEKK